jgi:DNA polymerase-3 subunit alpha
MAWVRLSDAGGSYEVTFFSEVLGVSRQLLDSGQPLLISADAAFKDDVLRITAQSVQALDEAASAAGAEMRVWLERTEAVEHIRALLRREGKGSGRVVLMPRIDASQSVAIALPGRFNVSPRLTQALKVVPGVARVEEV